CCLSVLCLFVMLFFFFDCYRVHRDLHSFPTRRSSDLLLWAPQGRCGVDARKHGKTLPLIGRAVMLGNGPGSSELLIRSPSQGEKDRKSTRLNSSHVKISYAVFCLKKKKQKKKT